MSNEFLNSLLGQIIVSNLTSVRKVTASHDAQNQNSLLETKLYGFVWKFNLRSIKRLKGTQRVSVSRNPPVARLSINCLTRTMASLRSISTSIGHPCKNFSSVRLSHRR